MFTWSGSLAPSTPVNTAAKIPWLFRLAIKAYNQRIKRERKTICPNLYPTWFGFGLCKKKKCTNQFLKKYSILSNKLYYVICMLYATHEWGTIFSTIALMDSLYFQQICCLISFDFTITNKTIVVLAETRKYEWCVKIAVKSRANTRQSNSCTYNTTKMSIHDMEKRIWKQQIKPSKKQWRNTYKMHGIQLWKVYD